MRRRLDDWTRTLALIGALTFCLGQPGFCQDNDGGGGDTAVQEEEADADDLVREAQSLMQSGKNELAAEVFKKATKADPEHGLAWHMLGYTLHMNGDLDEAIKAHKKATEFDQYRAISLYNLGCAHSLKKNADQSLEYLHKSLDAGFRQLDMFNSDADLVNVRKADGWKKIVMRVNNGGDMPATKFDASKLPGDWAVVSGTRSGAKVGAERLPQIKITKDTITIPAGPEDQFVMAYKLDESKKPVHIDMEIKSGPAPEGKAIGLIKLEGEHFVLCYDPTGEKRPTDFESTEENGFFMFKGKPAEKSSDKAEGKDKEDKDEEKGDG